MFTLKNSTTYKWIVGILTFIIVLQIAFLFVKEKDIIRVSFFDCLSVAATLSSIILSVVAMLYSFWSGRDTEKTYSQIEKSIAAIDAKVIEMSDSATQSTNALKEMQRLILDVTHGVDSISAALDTLQNAQTTEQDKKEAIENLRNRQNAMLMFLEKMK